MTPGRLMAVVLSLLFPAGLASAQSTSDLSKKLSNPVADMISVPLQYNYNDGFLGGRASQGYINIQPVIPFSISPNWNIIVRTIVPIVSQNDFLPNGSSQTGLGNTVQSFFFSPKKPTAGGLIWGVGPVVQYPTATDGIAHNQWGAGITGVMLKQTNGWTFGFLANQIWSLESSPSEPSTSATFLQPFVSYSTKEALAFTVNTESTYDWKNHEWSVPVNATVGKIFEFGGRPVQITGGVRYWVDSPSRGPDGWGARLMVTYMFPKG